jgi:serine/threonine protein kinase
MENGEVVTLALKFFMYTKMLADPGALHNAVQEVRIMHGILGTSSFVLPIYRVLLIADAVITVMPRAHQTLTGWVESRIKAKTGMTLQLLSLIATELLLALSDAHSLGVIHGDVKPDNVVVTSTNMPLVLRLIDFGAGFIGDPAGESLSYLHGTTGFVAPEIQKQPRHYSPAVDIYALGVTLLYVLLGRLPVPEINWEEVRMSLAVFMSTDKVQTISSYLAFMLHSDPCVRPSATTCLMFWKPRCNQDHLTRVIHSE